VLVATPGRLDDHLHNTAGVREMLQQLSVLVMDEADQLLDRGFRQSIVKILAMLPLAATRQTLLFSATFPSELQELTRSALRPQYEMVDCVGPGPQSNEQVEQQVTICSIDDLHATCTAVLLQHVRHSPEHKVMVFLQTAREAGFCAALFRQMDSLGTQVFEIHSKKSQPQRSKASEQFRLCRSGVLFSSDVSARGMTTPTSPSSSSWATRPTARSTCTALAAPRGLAATAQVCCCSATTKGTGCRRSATCPSPRSRRRRWTRPGR
jgi:ATP-dependent RNA helicase MSS116